MSRRSNRYRTERDRHQRLNAHADRVKEITGVNQLPLGIRALPHFAQWAYMQSYNDNIVRYGDAGLATKAAEGAARNAQHIIAEKQVNARKPRPQFDYDRLKPPRGATILVPA